MSSALPIKTYTKEAEVAVQAVLRACHVTKSVQDTLKVDDKVSKPDKSPVTIGDLAAQALITLHLQNAFPEDKIVGEEDTTELRKNDGLRNKVVGLVNEGFEKGKLGKESEGIWGEGESFAEDSVLTALDLGSHTGGPTGRSWTIDPIDGTLGFLRKEQYAVCLALIVDGIVQLGVLACPNLGTTSVTDSQTGVLFLAKKDEGGWMRSLKDDAKWEKTTIPEQPTPLRFLESVESGHSAHSVQARIGELLGVQEGTSLRMDSQAKYGALGRGEGGCYLRIPTKYIGGKDYQEKIWDHASGSLLISESGGVVSDMHGAPLDFSRGRTLSANEGIVAAASGVHAKAVESVKKAIEEFGKKV